MFCLLCVKSETDSSSSICRFEQAIMWTGNSLKCLDAIIAQPGSYLTFRWCITTAIRTGELPDVLPRARYSPTPEQRQALALLQWKALIRQGQALAGHCREKLDEEEIISEDRACMALISKDRVHEGESRLESKAVALPLLSCFATFQCTSRQAPSRVRLLCLSKTWRNSTSTLKRG